MTPIESIRCKIFRAVEHYRAFTFAADGYVNGKIGKIVMEEDPYLKIVEFEGPQIPPQIPLIIGDCLQNLRSSLDFLVWELCLASNVIPTNQHAFPICLTGKSFRDEKRKRLAGLPIEVLAQIKILQPCCGGDDGKDHCLWVLNELANINKHRRILLTKLSADFAHADRVKGTMRRRDAQTISDPEGEVDMDEEIVPYIAFQEGVAKDAEVGNVLNSIAEHIDGNVLPKFERFFK